MISNQVGYKGLTEQRSRCYKCDPPTECDEHWQDCISPMGRDSHRVGVAPAAPVVVHRVKLRSTTSQVLVLTVSGKFPENQRCHRGPRVIDPDFSRN